MNGWEALVTIVAMVLAFCMFIVIILSVGGDSDAE